MIPVYNGETYLAEAIRSVLLQTRPVLECIVVDDGSTDDTAKVIEAFGEDVKHIRQSRQGVSRARNRGAHLARGDVVAFLDHDDIWLPDKLEQQLAALPAEEAAMIVCAMEVIDAHGAPLATKRLRPLGALAEGMLTFDGTETVSCSSTGVVRRDAFLALGGFDPELSMSADWDLLFRAVLNGSLRYVDEPLVRYRVHDTNMSRDIARMERDMRRAFRKAFADPNLPEGLRSKRRIAYRRLYRMLAGSYRNHHLWSPAFRTLLLAALQVPAMPPEHTTLGIRRHLDSRKRLF